MVVTNFNEKFGALAEVDTTAHIVAALVSAEIAGRDDGRYSSGNTDTPERIANGDRHRAGNWKIEFTIVKTVSACCVHTEPFLLNKLISRVCGQAPQTHDRTLGKVDPADFERVLDVHGIEREIESDAETGIETRTSGSDKVKTSLRMVRGNAHRK